MIMPVVAHIAVLFLFVVLPMAQSTFCDETTMPYRLAISSNGSLELSCTKPICFRNEHTEQRSAERRNEKKATCFTTSWNVPCAEQQQWFGGISFRNLKIAKKCCSFSGMKFSAKIAELKMYAGDDVTGGEVILNSRQTSFDIIADVRKIDDDAKNVSYVVTVNRMACIPDPPEILNRVSLAFSDSLLNAVDEKRPRLPEVDVSNTKAVLSAEKIRGVEVHPDYFEPLETPAPEEDTKEEEPEAHEDLGTPQRQSLENTESQPKPTPKIATPEEDVEEEQPEAHEGLGTPQYPSSENTESQPQSIPNVATPEEDTEEEQAESLNTQPQLQPPPITGRPLPPPQNPDAAGPELPPAGEEEENEGTVTPTDAQEVAGAENEEKDGGNEEGEKYLEGGGEEGADDGAGGGEEGGGETDADGCFQSPTGHKCCSREVEQLLKDMQKMVNKMDEHANETSIKREMLAYIQDETEKRFCDGENKAQFDVLIGNSEYATEANVPKKDPNACKMEIGFGRRRLTRRVHTRGEGGARAVVIKKVIKVIVLVKQIVSKANDQNSKKLSFKASKETPKPKPNKGGEGTGNGAGNGAGGGAGGGGGGGPGAGAGAGGGGGGGPGAGAGGGGAGGPGAGGGSGAGGPGAGGGSGSGSAAAAAQAAALANAAAQAVAANAAAQANAANAVALAQAANAAAAANSDNAALAASAANAVAAANAAQNAAAAAAAAEAQAAADSQSNACFTDDMMVQTETGVKRMDQVVIGDRVLTADREMTSFSPVTMFIHREPKLRTEFYQIETIDGARMKLTAEHFVYLVECHDLTARDRRKVFAKDVRPGDCMLKVVEGRTHFAAAPVANITKVWQTGIYAPLTRTGLIVVNDLLASCHSSVVGHNGLHQTFFYYTHQVNSWLMWASGAEPIQEIPKDRVELSGFIQFMLSVLDQLVPQMT